MVKSKERLEFLDDMRGCRIKNTEIIQLLFGNTVVAADKRLSR